MPSFHDPPRIAICGVYVRQLSEVVWIPEINLAIGTGQGNYQGWEREWLYWYDNQGNRYPSLEEQAEAAQQQAEAAQQQASQSEQNLRSLVAKLQERGIDPNTL